MLRRFRKLLTLLLATAFVLQDALWLAPTPVYAQYTPGIPAAVDPGTPTFSGSSTPVPAEPAGYNPGSSMMQAIFDADVAAGGTSYWFDRILARPYLSADYQSALFTRGRALYMNSHTPGTLGFAGGYAYRERPTGSNQNLYTLSLSGATLSEATSQRVQYPSHWSSQFSGGSWTVVQKKFITDNNIAVTMLTLTNTGSSTASTTVTVTSPIATTASGSELTGSVALRYGLSTIYPRLSGDSFTVSGSNLTRTLSLGAGQSTSFKVQMGVLANELPESTADYNRYKGYNANTAFLTHLREYNQWWVDNVPYIDIPNANMKKMVYYRLFMNRFNHFDGNIPGNDFQFPVSIEGVLGYNNAIQLTQPMHMQDLKYFRNPIYSYGIWISSGESSKYGPFTDNPGDTAHWGVGNPNGTYEQYIARESWQSYKVHGGELALVNNLARYAEGDVTGQLVKYGGSIPNLIVYNSGTLTGNDADAVAFAYYQRAQYRTETSFWWEGAVAASEAYSLVGNTSKANSMSTTANNVKTAILNNLWDNSAASSGGKVFKQKDQSTGNLVPWKDQQNFAPFIAGPNLVANDANYIQALRYYADKAQFPIMPSYTANQADKAAAVAAGRGGSNNFSNINSTIQAQVFLSALRNYPSSSSYITQDSYRKLVEWLTWTQYINGDNRLPDNNEYWWSYNPSTGSMGRSGIHHNILGAYNFMIIEGFMGVTPRLDNTIELWPIDVGYDHFTLNNLRYHGQDLTLVWDKPGGTDYYGSAPDGYTLYVNGTRAFTVSDLTHLTWNSSSGAVTILGTPATVSFNTSVSLQSADQVSLSDNARMVDIAQKAGMDISSTTGGATNLARGKTVSASYTASGTSAANTVDGFTVSGLPITNFPNPIWGTQGSTSTQHWLEVNLGSSMTFDTVKLYFYDNKTFGISGNTYRPPATYTIQYYNGSSWVNVPDQVKNPSSPLPNYNRVSFPAITAQRVRVLMDRTGSYGIGIKEIQVFNLGQGPEPTPTFTPTGTEGPSPTPTITPTPTNTQLPPQTNPIIHYLFDGNANDSSGNGYNASLVNGPTFVTGQLGQAVNLDGSNGYANLPIGSVVSSLNDFTIATWVKLDTTGSWRRIFDFGTGTSVNMFLTPQSGSGAIRFAITNSGAGSEVQINGTSALPTGTWTHVAVTKSGNTGILYVNGVQVGQNTSMPLNPSSLGNTTQNWIGRSQYSGDSYLDGQIDDFRIYNRTLSESEVQGLANLNGPTNTPTLTPTITFTPTITLTPTITPTQDTSGLWAKYSLEGNANDSSGNNRNGTLVNSPTFITGRNGQAVSLNGSNQYVSLPTGIVSSLNDFTIATWVNANAISTWSRLFDFGTGTSVNMFLTPTNGSNIRFAITTSGSGGEQRINGTAPLTTGWHHVAVTLSGNTGTLYVDGVQVGQNTAMTLRPSSLGNTTQNWIGRSEYSSDPYLNGAIDEFRIYNRALSAAEILSLFQNP